MGVSVGRTLWSGVVALACVAALRAQAPVPAQAPPKPPVFRAGVNYVEVDATVLDGNRGFVGDLTQSDFTVLEDGKPEPISVFSKVEIPIERTATGTPPPATSGVARDAASNPPVSGRIFVLVLDDQQTKPERTQKLRAAASTFVNKYVGANDLVAVTATGEPVSQNFTSDKALVLKAIGRVMGTQAKSAAEAAQEDAIVNANRSDLPEFAKTDANTAENAGERERNAISLIGSLHDLVDYLGRIPDRRKAVVLFSSGPNVDPGNRDLETRKADMIVAANRANVSIYGVDQRGLVAAGSDPKFMGFGSDPAAPGFASQLRGETQQSQEILQVISDETGGFATINQNNLEPAFARIIEDNSTYYVLGYYPATDKLDGKFHTISVKVNRPGLTVRARKGYVAPNDKKPAPVEAVGHASPELAKALASPIPASAIPMHVDAAAFHGEGSNAVLSMTIELDASAFTFKDEDGIHTDRVELAVLSADHKSTVSVDSDDGFDLRLGSNYDQVRRSGFRIGVQTFVKPGHYRLLVGAREVNGGLIGTVPLDVDVPDFSNALTISGVSIAASETGVMPTTHPDMRFRGMLPSPPTARRDFGSGETLSLFAEVYDANPSAAPSVAATVRSAAGAVVWQSSGADRLERSDAGTYRYTARVPLESLAPGSYVLQIGAQAGAQHATRNVAFTIAH